jgi:hypothetical protein
MTTLDDLYYLAQGLYDTYQDRNTQYQHIDDMFYKRWELPSGMPEWVMKVVSTDPADAVMTTVRIFSALNPGFKIMPMLPNEANRQKANEIETAISYNFMQAGRRNDNSVTWDVMLSSALYADVAAQVIYLPYQEKVLKAMGKEQSARRAKAARRFGDFAFIIHNPANIYPSWSEYGLEGVLTIRVQTVDEFIASWGKRAEKLVDRKAYAEGKISYVTSYDYTDYEKRCVWGVPSEVDSVKIEGQGIKIWDEENKLGFIPYAVRRWGNSLSSESNKRVMPLLQSIYDSGQWDMLNSMESMDASLTVARASRPEYAGEFPSGQDAEIDNTEPSGMLKLPPGTRNFTPLPSQSVDQRLTMEKTQFKANIWQGTIAKALNQMDFPSGTAYSAINQILSAATNSLAPYRMLGEHALEEIAHQMLCWVKYYGKEYDKSASLYGQYADKTNTGKEVSIAWDTIDPDALQVEVSLTADIPVDKLQQINGAVLLYQNFRVPQEEVLEHLGISNPQEAAKRRDLEDYKAAYIQADLQRIAMQPQLEAQQQQMQQQAEMQQAQQSQAMEQEMMAREQEAALAGAEQNASPGNENLGGLGMNPAMGGMPPVMANRGQR